MFNRNARNKLSSMGGIASFQNGGPTRNPELYFGGGKSVYYNPKDTRSDIEGSNMSYIQKIAAQAKKSGIGSLSAIDKINLNMAMGQFAASQARDELLPGIKSNLKGSPIMPYIDAATQMVGAFGPGTVSGIGSVLFSGDPEGTGFASRVARGKPTDAFMKQVGFESLPTAAEILDEEAAVIGTPPPSGLETSGIEQARMLSDQGRRQRGQLGSSFATIDPTDPEIMDRIKENIRVQENLQGKTVRYNEKTGKYEEYTGIDPNASEILKEQSRMQQGQIQKSDISEEYMGGDVPLSEAPLTGKDEKDKKKELTEDQKTILKEEERLQKGQLGTISPKTKEEIANVINTGSKEEKESELKQLMNEFKQNAPKYEGLDKGLAIAKIGFAMAAGQSPDAVTNIAKALEGGADMFIKDKKERDAFNRQVDLAALKYGFQERSKDRKLKYFIADKDVTVDGRKYEKGSVVDLSEGFIRKNGIPSGLTTETLTKAAMDKAAAIKTAMAKLQKDKILSPKDFNTFSKRIDDAALSFTKSRNLQTLIQGQIFNVVDGNVTGLAPAGKALVKKAFNAAKIKGGLDKTYLSVEEYNTDMQKVANMLIQEILGEGSKNLSNVDRQLAQEIVGLYTTGASGVTGYVFQSDEILLRRLQGIHSRVVETQQKSLSEIEDVMAATNGLTFQSGQAVRFSKVKDLGLYGKPQGGTEGGKTQTIKLGDLLSDGKFDKDKYNKLLIG